MFFKRRKKKLDLHLNGRKIIKVEGFSFIIKKLNPLDYMSNDKVLLQLYDIYENKKKEITSENNLKKMLDHYKQVICAAVVNPKITFKEENGSLFVEDLFKDWDLVDKLYSEILLFTLGKKKFKNSILHVKKQLS